MLTTNPYVIYLSLDFSKAFDTVSHAILMKKLAKLDLPDPVYNWLGTLKLRDWTLRPVITGVKKCHP